MLTAPGNESMSPPAANGRRASEAARAAWSGPSLSHLLIVAFLIVAALPIGVLAFWESRSSFRLEMEAVPERHLLIARNLASTMARYAQDITAALGVALDGGGLGAPPPSLVDLLTSLDFLHVCILDRDGRLEAGLAGLDRESRPPAGPVLAHLRSLADSRPGRVLISALYHDDENRPVLYLVRSLSDGRLGLGIVSTAYLRSLQQSIMFGDHGYAIIVDGSGHVIAHPLANWVATARDLSAQPLVADILRGKTGVGSFQSAAYGSDMIAGYTGVPGAGWGVVVAQPIAELRERSSEVTALALMIAASSVVGVLGLGWLFALVLSRPLRRIVGIAEAVLAGHEDVSVPPARGLVPREIRRLGAAFNQMLAGLRHTAAETRQALHQAEMSSQAKTQFLANMSHELRTPLNEIVGSVELMRLTELTSAQRRYLDSAMRSGTSLLRVVDDILDLSSIEAGKLDLEMAPFHLPTLVHDVRLMLADQAQAKGLTLAAMVPESLNIIVLGDAHRLLQILSNLVGNAVKFTASGSVTIRVALEQEFGAGLRLRFEVSDTGIGIPIDKQATIFEAFAQSDSSMTRRHGGTGLGLSIARRLCHMMDGDIGVRSEPGHGSTFWFTVSVQRSVANAAPLPPVSEAGAPLPPPAFAADGAVPVATAAASISTSAGRAFQAALRQLGIGTPAILVVEDTPASMRVTAALLETLGCVVTGAENGLQAVAAYRSRRFDLVLMDCQMPEMDGYEATRAIRQLEHFTGRRTPIIALTAHAMPGSREVSVAAGMDDQLTKPLTLSALTGMLLAHLTPAGPAA